MENEMVVVKVMWEGEDILSTMEHQYYTIKNTLENRKLIDESYPILEEDREKFLSGELTMVELYSGETFFGFLALMTKEELIKEQMGSVGSIMRSPDLEEILLERKKPYTGKRRYIVVDDVLTMIDEED